MRVAAGLVVVAVVLVLVAVLVAVSPSTSVPCSSSVVKEAASATCSAPGLLDGLVDGGLEALEVDDQVRLAELARSAAGLSSRSCGSTPGLVRLVTATWSPPICSARNCHGIEGRHHVELAVAAPCRRVPQADRPSRPSAESGGGGEAALGMRRRRTFMTVIFNEMETIVNMSVRDVRAGRTGPVRTRHRFDQGPSPAGHLKHSPAVCCRTLEAVRHSVVARNEESTVAADKIDTIVSLSKRRGFVYPCSEIYGGQRAAWDYGPLGVELKENIKRQWWRSMVTSRDDVVGSTRR